MERRERFVSTNHIRLHVIQAGPDAGPLAILLHGFPEFWYGWRHQIDSLAAKGYRVWVPDQRGYNQSDKPQGVADYSLDCLADDVVGLIDAAGAERAFLAGHDWGTAAAWWVAARNPNRIARLAILNVPHPVVMQRHIWRSPRQMLRSWYIGFFQIPRLPEYLASWNNYQPIVRMLRASSHPGTFADDDLALYRKAWSAPGALTAMLNWYRAIVRKPPRHLADPRIHVPTLILWGVKDIALGSELAPASLAMCDDGDLVFFENATHWVQHEEPEQVNSLLHAFFEKGI